MSPIDSSTTFFAPYTSLREVDASFLRSSDGINTFTDVPCVGVVVADLGIIMLVSTKLGEAVLDGLSDIWPSKDMEEETELLQTMLVVFPTEGNKEF